MPAFYKTPSFYALLAIAGCGLVLVRMAIIMIDTFRRKIDLPGPRQWPLVGQGFDLLAGPRQILREY